MDGHIDSVTIVGGGSAGWVMALYLTTVLNRSGSKNNVEITLIESPRIPNIGVGEGTVTGFSYLLRQLNIPETEFMRASDATFKCAGTFVGWNLDADGQPISFLNPFNDGGYLEGFETAYHYHKYGGSDPEQTYLDATLPTEAVVMAGRGPKLIGEKEYEGHLPYTYHLNAKAFSDQLAKIAKERGVHYIQDEMQDVELDERGYISAINLEERGRYPVKFVIDCTGFRGSILQGALGEPFIDYGKHLLCDRAIPIQIQHENNPRIMPASISKALSAGWVFGVPLYSRMGTGYIYSSQFKSDDEAFAELKEFLGDRAPDDVDPRVIRMKIGRVRNTWVKNCIAAGLSAGFVEPLEATAIYSIEQTARTFVSYFPLNGIEETVVKHFNAVMDAKYSEILDFIVMFYYTSNRPEPFWKAARGDIEVPDTLRENMETWEHFLPSLYDVEGKHLFTHWDYLYILMGKQWFDGKHFPAESLITRLSWEKRQAHIRQSTDNMLKNLPDHRALLQSIHEPQKSAEASKWANNMKY